MQLNKQPIYQKIKDGTKSFLLLELRMKMRNVSFLTIYFFKVTIQNYGP